MGNEKIHLIDQLFNQHLSEAEAPVRDNVWEGISAQMENGRLRKKILFARITAAASLLLLLGIGTWMLWGNGPQQQQQFAAGNIISLPQAGPEDGIASTPLPANNVPALQFSANSNRLLGSFPRAGFNLQPSTSPKVAPAPDSRSNLSQFFIDQHGSPNRIGKTLPVAKSVSQNSSKIEEKAVFAAVDADVVEMPVEEENGDVVKENGTADQLLDKTPELQNLESIMAQKRNQKDKMELSPLVDEMFGANDAQEDSPESPSFNRFSVGGSFSPDYTFATTAPIQEANPNSRSFKLQDPADADQTNSEFVTAFSTGLNVGYRVSERLGLQSGVVYMNRTSNTTSELDAFGKTDSYNSSFSVSFVEVPLLVQYDLVSRDNFSYYVSSGMSANLLWDYDNTLTNPEGRVAARVLSSEERKFQPTQANLLLRTGVRYNILDNLSLNIEPGLRYGILSNKYAFANGNPLALSLSTGAAFNF